MGRECKEPPLNGFNVEHLQFLRFNVEHLFFLRFNVEHLFLGDVYDDDGDGDVKDNDDTCTEGQCRVGDPMMMMMVMITIMMIKMLTWRGRQCRVRRGQGGSPRDQAPVCRNRFAGSPRIRLS